MKPKKERDPNVSPAADLFWWDKFELDQRVKIKGVEFRIAHVGISSLTLWPVQNDAPATNGRRNR